MSFGKIIYYLLLVPIFFTGIIVWIIDKINFTVDLMYQLAKQAHTEIKDFK
jgi:5-bromo-4-chloroindolyl phosphate hydrolysis protein